MLQLTPLFLLDFMGKSTQQVDHCGHGVLQQKKNICLFPGYSLHFWLSTTIIEPDPINTGRQSAINSATNHSTAQGVYKPNRETQLASRCTAWGHIILPPRGQIILVLSMNFVKGHFAQPWLMVVVHE